MGQKIILFTDLHFGNNVENKSGKQGVNTHGGNILAKIHILIQTIKHLNPVFIINLGDAIQAKSKDNALALYKEFLSLFSGMKIFHILGNHDTKYALPKEILQLLDQESHLSFELGGYKHIIIDSFKKGEEVSMPEKTLVWLKNQLETKKKVIIYSHYPISQDTDNLGYYHKEYPYRAFLLESKQIREILEISGNVVAFISGHTHFYFSKEINGIKYYTIPSFSEDDNNKPSLNMGILDLDTLNLEIKKI